MIVLDGVVQRGDIASLYVNVDLMCVSGLESSDPSCISTGRWVSGVEMVVSVRRVAFFL